MCALLVQVNRLCVSFDSRRYFRGTVKKIVLHGASLDIVRGQAVGLVGESGSGKTTLGRAILRLIDVESGSVRFDGVDVFESGPKELKTLRRRMQIVFQDPGGSLNPRMRIGAIVAEPMEIHRIGEARHRRARTGLLLERVGLGAALANRFPHELSGGQKQRVGIARALALDPEFVVLDEPVSALDVSVQAQILALLEELKRDLKLTFLFIAHNLAVVRRICDQVAVMRGGQIVENGPTSKIFDQPQHAYTQALLAAIPGLTPLRQSLSK